MNRRMLLKSAGAVMFASGLGAVPAFLTAAAAQAEPLGRNKILVAVYQRFGMDGLFAVTPYGDERLAALRPSLMLSRPGSSADDARIDLDGQFGLHPSLAPLEPLYRSSDLAFIHAAGSPDTTRSHSVAALWWESGAPGDRSVRDGWMARAAADTPHGASDLHAMAMTDERPRAFYGDTAVTSTGSLDRLLASTQGDLQSRIAQLYEATGNPELKNAAVGAEAIRALAAAPADSAHAARYPRNSAFGDSLRDIARVIKADVGLRVAFAESRNGANGQGSWDSHSDQASMTGGFAAIADDYARSLAAFWADLGDRAEDVVLVNMTDFGRNVPQNDGIGTDHGRATMMMVLGGGVNGGKVYGQLPERFERDALEDQMDLPVTTDYRSVLAAAAGRQLGLDNPQSVFPGYSGGQFEGLIA